MSDLVAIVPVADELLNALNFSTASSKYSRSKSNHALVLLLARTTKKLITLCCFCLMVAAGGGSSLESDSSILEF